MLYGSFNNSRYRGSHTLLQPLLILTGSKCLPYIYNRTVYKVTVNKLLRTPPDMCQESHWLHASSFQYLGLSGLRRCYGDCDGIRWRRRGWRGGRRHGAEAPDVETTPTCHKKRSVDGNSFYIFIQNRV